MWWDKPGKKQRPDGPPFPFMKFRFAGFFVIAAVVIVTTVSLFVQGLNFGLDFTGGVQIEAASPAGFDPAAVRARLTAAGFEDANVTTADGGHAVLMRLPPLEAGANVETVSREIIATLGQDVTLRKVDAIGPRVSGELLQKGILASVLSLLAIAVYVWFRFESRFGLAALITTFHDVYAVIGLFSLTQMTFDLTIVAGVLTVAGYSINDTVVVFDRIREMLKKYKKLPLRQIVDISITATLSRTLITSVATLIATLSMLVWGGPVLFGFAASITGGIVIGTFSSVFVAAPLLIHLPGRTAGPALATPPTTQAEQGA